MSFAGFQCTLFASALVATPASPMPPALASGVIPRKGTAVVITLFSSSCPTMFGGEVCAWPVGAKPKAANAVKSMNNLKFIAKGKGN